MTNHEPKHTPADMAGLDGLIERLRSVDVSWSETGEWCAEAATQLQALKAENERLRSALKGIDVYGTDTLSGRVIPEPATYKDWLIEGVIEMRNRARAALEGTSHE